MKRVSTQKNGTFSLNDMEPTPPALKILKASNRGFFFFFTIFEEQVTECGLLGASVCKHSTDDVRSQPWIHYRFGLFLQHRRWNFSIYVSVLNEKGRWAAGRPASAPGGRWARRDRPRQRRTVRSSWTSRDSPPWQRGSTDRTPPVRETGGGEQG